MSSQPTPRRQAILDGMRAAGAPSRYLDVKPAPLPDGGWAYVTGVCGSGKTRLACGMLRDHIESNLTCCEVTGLVSETIERVYFAPKAHFVTVRGYLAAVKAAYDGDGGRARACRLSPFLVVDDLGQEMPTQWAVGEIYDLIDYRYGERLPTVITSQFGRNRIARRLAQNGGEEQALAIASRLVEMCRVIDLGKRDRRLA